MIEAGAVNIGTIIIWREHESFESTGVKGVDGRWSMGDVGLGDVEWIFGLEKEWEWGSNPLRCSQIHMFNVVLYYVVRSYAQYIVWNENKKILTQDFIHEFAN